MAIVRTYECGACGTKFDKLHFDRNEPPPECPGCAALASRQVPAGFSIGNSNMSKAVDITQDIVEKDYGLTNMRDNLREGDIAAPRIAPHLQKSVDTMWNAPNNIISAARAAGKAAAQDKRNPNPLRMVQGAKKRAGLSPKVICNPVNNDR